MRTELAFRRMRRFLIAAAALAAAFPLASQTVSAGTLFDFFFGGAQKQHLSPSQATSFTDPFAGNPHASPLPSHGVASSGPAFCVRTCDGKYFPLTRGSASAAQLCEALCPASRTKVYFGFSIDTAYGANGERYADSKRAYAYRRALSADCTCNGHDPAGLAPIDLTLDASLRAGDLIATTEGLVAFSGVKLGNSQAPEFMPIASYPGLTADMRSKLGEIRVARPVLE